MKSILLGLIGIGIVIYIGSTKEKINLNETQFLEFTAKFNKQYYY